MEALNFELIMTNAFDAIVIAIFDIVVEMIPTILLIVGIVIVVGVVLRFFNGILLEDNKTRDKEDREIERDFDKSVDRFMEDWS
jgi:hypothetical protein